MATADAEGVIPTFDGSIKASRSDDQDPSHVQLPFGRFQRIHIVIIIAVVMITSGVTDVISLPLYIESIKAAGSDPYVVVLMNAMWSAIVYGLIWLVYKYTLDRNIPWRPHSFPFTMLIGFLNSLNGILVVYASAPSRTPPYLQAILYCSIIPFTVIVRYIILRKGKYSETT